MTQTNLPPPNIRQADHLLVAQNSSVEQSSNRLVNIVIVVLTVVAFLPAFLDRHFYDSMPRFIISLVLGVTYGLIGTSQLKPFKQLSWRMRLFIYFSLQLIILSAIFILGKEYDNNFWLLMLPLSAQGTSMGWLGSIGISFIQLGLFWRIFWWQLAFAEYSNALLSIATAILFTVLFTIIAFREQDARIEIERLARDLQSANYRLAEYAAQVEELATMRERNRLAREIHDNLGHFLTVVNVQIEAARTIMEVNPDKAQDALTKAQKLTQDGLASVRQSVSTLRESPLAQRTLSKAISLLVQENQSAGIASAMTVTGEPRPLDPKIELTLYRAAQEGLTNVRKHARASQVDLYLDYQSDQYIQLQVKDNGIGVAKADGGFGLLGIQERVQLLNGTINIETEPGKGFTLTIQIPIPQENGK
ncbi:MAG: sensor histidine kinase [Anaerolineales bacterium]|nr:sensor histidine kinase [Anaerolineales bacterium]